MPAAFVSDAAFWDVGTVDDYWRTSLAFAAADPTADLTRGEGQRIHPSARVVNSILWDDVEIGRDAVIEDSIVTDGARIGAGRSVRGTIVMR